AASAQAEDKPRSGLHEQPQRLKRVTKGEPAMRFLASHFGPQSTKNLPLSFIYDRQRSQQLLPSWQRSEAHKELDKNRTQYTITYSDPRTKLEVRCEVIAYSNFPTIEWTAYFKNKGDKATPILDEIQALDTRFECSAGKDFLLHHHYGSHANRADYAPRET